MEVFCGCLAPLAERVQNPDIDTNKIYSYFEEEKLKVYAPFSHQFVGKILTQQKIKSWIGGGYCIVSQTGSGKSTLIKETISQIVSERKTRILLIVPRVALAVQYKREFAELYCPQILEELQDKGIKKRSMWGPADIFTMQEVSNSNTRSEILKNRRNYDFVVIDEVHAFTGDASFNPYTEDILRFIVCEVGKRCKRLYLTATPEIILDEIVEIENQITDRPYPGIDMFGRIQAEVMLTFYQFKSNYAYLKPYFFEQEDTIIQHFRALPVNEKGVIFVKSKSQGICLQEKLGKERALYMDAVNKQTTEEENFSKMIQTNTFNKQFLIVTRFLDVGVNLKDWNIKHMVIFQYFKEDIIQMLGRKRILLNEEVNLYVRIPKCREIELEISQLQNSAIKMGEIRLKYQSTTSALYNELPIPVFLKSDKGHLEMHYNRYSFCINYYHQRQLHKYIEGVDYELKFNEQFKQIVLSWFPNHRAVGNLEKQGSIDISFDEELEATLKPLVGFEMDKERMLEINSKLLDIFKISRRSDQVNQIAMSKLKECFLKFQIPYRIKNLSKKGKNGFWMVERGEWV